MVRVYSKFDFGLPRRSGSFDVTVSLAGNSLASVTATGSVAWLSCPSALTVRVCAAQIAALAGTSRRSCSATLASGAGIAAATGWPPPSSVAVQPLGTPATESWYRSGRARNSAGATEWSTWCPAAP